MVGRSYSNALLGLATVVVACGINLTPSPFVFGQTASAAIETVVVTAERRPEPLQKTSIAATVFSGEELTTKNIQTIDALQFTTPALSIQNFGGGDLINLRGIGKSDGGVQDPAGTIIYRDGVPTAFSGFDVDEPYYDITSIEILRGPQGTFAGENATGGAIYIKEADPNFDGYGGWAEAQYGNYNDALVRGAVNVPLSDNFAMRFAVNAERRDSFFHITGPWTGNPGRLGELNGRLGFLWDPTSSLSILFKVDYNYVDNGGYPQNSLPASATLFTFANNAHLMGLEQWVRPALTINYKFADGVTLRSISGMTYARNAWARDIGPAPTPGLLGPPSIYTARAWGDVYSQELDLISPTDEKFNWVVGAYYENGIVVIPTGGFDLSLAPGGALDFLLKYKTPKSDWAFYGQGTYAITDALQLQVGLRYTQSYFAMTDTSILSFSGFLLPYSNIVNEKQSDSRLTGKVALNYNLNDDNFLYAFVATGHKAGGVNTSPSFFSPPGTLPPVFQPEDVTDFEVGWKGSYFDDRLHTQLGGFYNQYKRFQVSVEDVSQISHILNVAGTSTIDGVEAQTQGQFGDFSFDTNFAYVNSSLGTFFAEDPRQGVFLGVCSPTAGPASLLTGCTNLSGRQQPNSPRFTASVGMQYTFHIMDNDTLTPRFDYGMVGSRWTTLFENPLADHLGANNLVNASLIYNHNSWEIAAFATNLTNLQYVSSAGVVAYAPGPPRQFGVRVTKTF